MATYRFENLNGGSDIVDPAIEVQRKLLGLDPDLMTVDVMVHFNIIDGNGKVSRFGKPLQAIPISNLTYNYAGLTSLVMVELQQYIIP